MCILYIHVYSISEHCLLQFTYNNLYIYIFIYIYIYHTHSLRNHCSNIYAHTVVLYTQSLFYYIRTHASTHSTPSINRYTHVHSHLTIALLLQSRHHNFEFRPWAHWFFRQVAVMRLMMNLAFCRPMCFPENTFQSVNCCRMVSARWQADELSHLRSTCQCTITWI